MSTHPSPQFAAVRAATVRAAAVPPAPGPDPRPTPGPVRRGARAAAALVTLVLVAVGLTAVLVTTGPGTAPTGAPSAPGAGATPDPATDPATGGTREGAPSPVGLGVFRGTDPAAVEEFGRWLGRDVDLVVDFSTRETWSQIAAPDDLLRAWQGSAARVVHSVALLPGADPSATVARGAAGEYDGYYRELAGRLVGAGQADAIVRLGWEFNLAESRWATDDPGAFTVYWRRVVGAMRSVPGQRFAFDWNPNNGTTRYDAVEYYPGDDVVDYVGVDAYDVAYTPNTYPYPAGCDGACRLDRQERAWRTAIHGGRRGLRFWSGFAAEHGKPLSLPEWGLWERADGHGGGENAYYLERMAEFIADPRNNVAYQAYFEFDGPDGAHRLMTDYPAAGEVYRRLFGPSASTGSP